MKTEIINDSEPSAVAPVEYPALYQHKSSGLVLLSLKRGVALALSAGISPVWKDLELCDESITDFHKDYWTRLTTPITIKFTP